MKYRLQYWYFYIWTAYYRLREYLRSIWPILRSADEIERAKAMGCALDAEARIVAKDQLNCNHRKGGTIWGNSTESIDKALQNGTASQYSVIKHQHLNGDIWVECIRCGKKWKPPIRNDYRNDREFYKALEEYEKAVEFETNNATSTSLQFLFKLNGNVYAGHEYVRKQMANS